MTEDALSQAIYNKYIRPLCRKPTDACGVEFELPIVNLDRAPVDFDMVHRMTESFMTTFGFEEGARDDDGYLYSLISPANGDNISFDCSYNTLEISFGAEADLNELDRRFRIYYMWFQDYLDRSHHTLTGMGLNPYRRYNRVEPIASERYRMLLHHLRSYPKYGDRLPFHSYPEYGLFTAANQIQMDVTEDNAPWVINTFARLEPLEALLLANSWMEEEPGRLINRDSFWRDSTHGINPRNVGMPQETFSNIDDVAAYIRSMSLYCVMRDGHYIHFTPMPLDEYISCDEIVGQMYDPKGTGAPPSMPEMSGRQDFCASQNIDGPEEGRHCSVKRVAGTVPDGDGFVQVEFKPEIGDIAYLRSFTFEDLTFRGTIEFRSVCEQPVSEIFASPALHAGLMAQVGGLREILSSSEADDALFGHGFTPAELREMCTYRDLPDWMEQERIIALWKEILDLAAEGLKDRGYGEEHFLEPLYERAKTLTSPALEMVRGLESGDTIEDWIIRRSVLPED